MLSCAPLRLPLQSFNGLWLAGGSPLARPSQRRARVLLEAVLHLGRRSTTSKLCKSHFNLTLFGRRGFSPSSMSTNSFPIVVAADLLSCVAQLEQHACSMGQSVLQGLIRKQRNREV